MDAYTIITPWPRIYRWIYRYRLTRHAWQISLWVLENIWLAFQSGWMYLRPRNRYVRMVNDYVKHHALKHENTFTFLKALALNPGATGAILPSSKYLARTMAAYVQFTSESLVVELGAGTGVMTAAMIQAGVPPQQIVAVEYAPQLAKKLKERFPEIEVIEGNAAYLQHFLKDKPQAITTIISGLPLRSLPKNVSQAILEQIPLVLAENGRYIQFTYDIRSNSLSCPQTCDLEDTTIVWRNIPPAKVDVFVKTQPTLDKTSLADLQA